MGQMTGHRSLNRDGSNRKAGTGLSAEESIYLPNSVAFSSLAHSWTTGISPMAAITNCHKLRGL